MSKLVRIPISIKVILVCLVVSLGNALLMVKHSEEELEAAILSQVKNQIFVYLQGIVWEIRALADPVSPAALQKLLQDRHRNSQEEDLDFSILKIYLYDLEGQVIAYSGDEQEQTKDMAGHYGEVVRRGEPYFSKTVEFSQDTKYDKPVAVSDAIVPVRLASGVMGGLEAEINMSETLDIINERDNRYESAIAWMILLHAVLLSVLVSWSIHRLLVRHVHQYDDVTQAIGSGQLSSRVEGRLPGDEVGRLGGAINRMAENIERLIKEQEESYLQSLRSLMHALEAKDAYTAGHSARVSQFAVRLGRHLGLADEELELLRKGALMHDLGKIGVRDAILNKPSPLSEEEFAEMKSHPEQTAAIMRPLHRFRAFMEIAAWHHERWDGQGYPDALQGEDIPLLARIVSIADTWDAMTGDRVYRKGMPVEKALAILEREQYFGQWDPFLVAHFVQMIRQDVRKKQV